MLMLGVDPGQSGGLAIVEVLDDGIFRLKAGIRMPMMELKGRKHLSVSGLVLWLEKNPVYTSVIEQVSAMPRQGVTSSFNFGRVTGAIETVMLEHMVTVDWVTPAVWKKYYQLDSNKQKSLDLANHKFPGNEELFKVKANDGIAEAALIACYRLEQLMKL